MSYLTNYEILLISTQTAPHTCSPSTGVHCKCDIHVQHFESHRDQTLRLRTRLNQREPGDEARSDTCSKACKNHLY